MSNLSIRQKAIEATSENTEIKNVADLVQINIDTVLESRTFAKGTDKEFTINGFEVDGVFYRVPNTVVTQIKILLEDIPDLQFVKVKKSGKDLNTVYMVSPV